MKQEKILEISNLKASYSDSDFSLNVSLDIPKGYIIGLIGENGAGKTTFINSILGIKKIDSGNFNYWGEEFDIDNINLKSRIGVCFDDIYLPKNLKLYQVEKIYSGIYKKWDKAFFYNTLKKFDISVEKRIEECSKGMQKMFSIILTLSASPDFLILDEPTSALDPVKRKDVLELFQDFIMEEEKSILFSSHITTDIEQIADIVVYMRKGKIQFVEPITKLLNDYVILRCSEQVFEANKLENMIAYRKRSNSYEILLSSYEGLELDSFIIDTPKLEDIMNIYSKGVVL